MKLFCVSSTDSSAEISESEMNHETGPLAADDQFFKALIDADVAALEDLLAADFILVDVMGGSEVPKAALIAMVGSGQLKFESIVPHDSHLRIYGATGVVIGRTEMQMRFEQTTFTTKSRYTHVYVEERGRWRMVSAQGTPIAAE
jgi:ketosteroid isomerase-like protein